MRIIASLTIAAALTLGAVATYNLTPSKAKPASNPIVARDCCIPPPCPPDCPKDGPPPSGGGNGGNLK